MYPGHPNQSKAAAFDAWNARLNAGHTVEEMIAGTERYRRYECEAKFRLLAKTFLGPGLHFELPWINLSTPKDEEIVEGLADSAFAD